MSCNHFVAIVLLSITACAQTISSAVPVSVRHFVAPAYPPAAWLARVQGTAVAEVTIKADGTVSSVTVISAHPMFRDSLETALKQWSFQTSTATSLRVTTRFDLDADCPLSGSGEPGKRYYIQTNVTAELPSNVDVRTCLPVITINTSKSRH